MSSDPKPPSVKDEPESDLRELSLEDADELRAFQEKRRWFELLEGLPAINPFCTPHLAKQDAKEPSPRPVYKDEDTAAGEDGASFRVQRLPDKEEVKRWQLDRDALEQEVLDFDDGDLGRMKAKTRAVTQVPLTPPSTQLVEVTLDLILLIDRLLSLLRARYELLELTSLRLEWDTLRWSITNESTRLSTDLEKALREHVIWLQVHVFPSSTSDQPLDGPSHSGTDTDRMPTPVTPSTSPRIGVSPIPASPSASRHYRRQSLQSSLLRQTMTNLRVRHSTLQNTSVKQAGVVMDQMIDRAASLKSLGGIRLLGADVKDQSEEDGGGAVPEEFLDIQDDVENGVNALHRDLVYGKALEKWLDDTERSFTAHTEARASASATIVELRDAMSRSATSETYSRLHEQLASAQSSLKHLTPPGAEHKPVNHTLPNLHAQVERVATGTQAAITTCKKDMQAAEACLDWYHGLTVVTSKLLAHHDVLQNTREGLDGAAHDVEKGRQEMYAALDIDSSSMHPDVGDFDWQALISNLRQRLLSAQAVIGETRGVIAGYQTAATDRPRIVIERIPKPTADTLCKAVEKEAALLSKAVSHYMPALTAAEQFAAVFERLCAVRHGIRQCEAVEAQIESGLAAAIDKARWDSADKGSENTQDSYGRARGAARDFLSASHQLLTDWGAVTGTNLQEVGQWFPAVWSRRSRAVEAASVKVKTLDKLADKIHLQAQIVVKIRREADELLSEADNGVLLESSRQARLSWADALASRVALVDMDQTDIFTTVDPVMTERLRASQAGLRRHLNELAVRVQQGGLQSSDPTQSSPSPTNVREQPAKIVDHPCAPLGTATTADAPQTAEEAVKRIRRRFRDYNIPHSIFPRGDHIDQSIPSAGSAQRIAAVMDELDCESQDETLFPSSFRQQRSYIQLMDEISTAKAHLPRLTALGHFDTAVQVAREALQTLRSASMGPETQDLAARASSCVRAVIEASGAVESDARVRAEVARIKTAWAELAETYHILNDAQGNPEDGFEINHSSHSDTTSLTSPPASPLSTDSRSRVGYAAKPSIRKPYQNPFGDHLSASSSRSRQSNPGSRSGNIRRFPSSSSLLRLNGNTSAGPGSRTTSNPFPDRLTQPTASSRNRTVSDAQHLTPARRRVDSLASSISRMSLASAHGSRISGGRTGISETGARRSSRLSGSGVSGPEPTSRSASNPPNRRTGPYVPNKQSELDMAIGKIVNDLKVDVPIAPAPGRMSSAASIRPLGSASGVYDHDEWQEESGRYWIGYEGRAKLCFCRILKSRMVMVRVGGGWMELSRFLLDHFSQMTWTSPEDVLSPSTSTSVLATPNPVQTQDTLDPPLPVPADTNGAIDAENPGPEAPSRTGPRTHSPSPLTPVRSKQYAPHLSVRSKNSTPSERTPMSAGLLTPLRTPTGLRHAQGESPSAGLVPLHFIRKASNSPPVREREKERFAGRRSILGKGTPTKVDDL